MGDALGMGASKSESTLLTFFVPGVDRDSQPIDQKKWEQAVLDLLGSCFGGATAFPKGRGVWRDDVQDGKLVYDETIVVHCYTNLEALEKHRDRRGNGSKPWALKPIKAPSHGSLTRLTWKGVSR